MVPNAKRNLRSVWEITDDIFQRQVTRKKAFDRPIPFRHPYIFYLGHLPAFAWRQIRHIRPQLPHINAQYEVLFERGIDPNIDTHSPRNGISTWPTWDSVLEFRDVVRAKILQQLMDQDSVISNRTLSIINEHDAMHNETLAYMMAQSMRDFPAPMNEVVAIPISTSVDANGSAINSIDFADEWCYVHGDTVSLGTDDVEEDSFVWDNEVGNESHDVKSFHVRKYPVTNCEFAKFIRANGYNEEKYWDEMDWAWVRKHGIESPASFRRNINLSVSPTDFWTILTSNGYVNLKKAADWPVFVSLAEAKAYAKWADNNSRLPTEAEWNLYSRGSKLPTATNISKRYPHDVRSGARSEYGVVDCIGNGWEWTVSLFEPFKGFKAMPEYPEYSADFFDGYHFVLKGASYATWGRMVRRSFRNFFQRRYPYVFAQFRLVKSI